MHFSAATLGLVASFAAAVSAGKVTFWTLDDKVRTIYFTPNPGSANIDAVTVSSAEKTTVDFPEPYVGNFYAVQEGHKNSPGMLGEINFSGWNGKTYFDVSAIVDASDKENVKQMWPADSKSPMSGCEVFPCNSAYYLPDDIQTKVTDENHLITTLGTGSTGMKFME
ncbi:hypothetical protein N3K66_006796 [Trichothecium roseum]|uniref:Uncharacterized protein n=1 Tax=Trichothecium roseum TaxID=47278 RepID=A0ACC0UWE4_9HYPO|nr:hypothetical protein N3K66_006796 [Trichothecium roseum]